MDRRMFMQLAAALGLAPKLPEGKKPLPYFRGGIVEQDDSWHKGHQNCRCIENKGSLPILYAKRKGGWKVMGVLLHWEIQVTPKVQEFWNWDGSIDRRIVGPHSRIFSGMLLPVRTGPVFTAMRFAENTKVDWMVTFSNMDPLELKGRLLVEMKYHPADWRIGKDTISFKVMK